MKGKLLKKLLLILPKKLEGGFLRTIIRREGGEMFSKTLREIYLKRYGIQIGYGTYGGCFSVKNIPPGTSFGNYCSIARDVKIFRANHPREAFTTHPLLYNPVVGYVKRDCLERPPIIIGHDVWIGASAIILPKVKKIGNGAIIGAGSIVTRDVEPYSVVVGNPAKIVARRFNNDVIEVLEKTKWWELKKKELIKCIDDLNSLISEPETYKI